MANRIEWNGRNPVAVATAQNGEGRYLLTVKAGELTLKGGVGADRRRVVRDVHGAYSVVVGKTVYPLSDNDCAQVEALRDLFGDWTDPAWLRASQGGEVKTRAKQADTTPCPDILLGLPGEVATVTNWPMLPVQIRKLSDDVNGTYTDCLIHFDRIRLGSYNSRRVRMHDGVVYVTINKRCVPLGGALLEQVKATVTRVYSRDELAAGQAQRLLDEQAAMASERYDEENVHDDETKC